MKHLLGRALCTNSFKLMVIRRNQQKGILDFFPPCIAARGPGPPRRFERQSRPPETLVNALPDNPDRCWPLISCPCRAAINEFALTLARRPGSLTLRRVTS